MEKLKLDIQTKAKIPARISDMKKKKKKKKNILIFFCLNLLQADFGLLIKCLACKIMRFLSGCLKQSSLLRVYNCFCVTEHLRFGG